MIPQITKSLVLPPFLGRLPGGRSWASPYHASMSEVVGRYATSPARAQLLRGLLSYRHALFAAGLSDGYQWLAGSFVEDVERERKRPPHDIDVVTFSYTPVDAAVRMAWLASHRNLLDRGEVKRRFLCDGFFVDLRKPADLLVDDTCFLFGLYSHQRASLRWKGILKIPLASDDSAAKVQLMAIASKWEANHDEQSGI